MAMDRMLSDFQQFESYSAFKKICLPVSSDEKFIEKLIDSWQADPLKCAVLSKINVLWDTGPIAQKKILLISGDIAKSANAIIESHLLNEDFTDYEEEEVSAAIRILLNVSTRLDTFPLVEDHHHLITNMKKLIASSSRLPIESFLLAGSAIASINALVSKSDEDFLQTFEEILNTCEDDLMTICLINGLLTSVKPVILLGVLRGSEQTFLIDLVTPIIKLCSKTSKYEFHSFLLLRLWCSKLRNICLQVRTESEDNYKVDFSPVTLSQVLAVCRNNLENPTKGVSVLCLETFVECLQVRLENQGDEETEKLKDEQFSAVEKLCWYNKSKYVQISALVTVFGANNFLNESFAQNLATCLSSTHLVHAGTQLYRNILSHMSYEQWEQVFGQVIIKCLLSQDQGVRLACLEQWLGVTVKHFDQSVGFILGAICSDQSESGLHTKLSILKVCKKEGIGLGINDQLIDHIDILQAGLFHGSQLVRCAAFSLVCNAKKKGTIPCSREFALVLEFLSSCGSDVSSKSRQNLESSFNILLARCRDYCAMKFRYKKRGKDSEFLVDVIYFLDSCMKTFLDNLLPGGNYQRKIFSLDMLVLMVKTFLHFQPGVGSNKKSGNGDPSDFVKFAQQEHGRMILDSRDNLEILILNTTDHMTDVKEKSCFILKQVSITQQDYSEIHDKMLFYLSSPKESYCETGAMLAKLLCHWKNDNNVSISGSLLHLLENSLNAYKKDFLISARYSAMYGITMALRKVLFDDDSTEQLTLGRQNWTKLICLLESISDMMLAVLGKADNGQSNPDFQEMAQSVNNVIEEDEDDIDDVSIPEEHQLVLSAAWHNLKECLLLAGEMVQNLKLEIDPVADQSLSYKEVESCFNLVIMTISSCRHKGVIEASYIATNNIATALLSSKIDKFQQLPRRVLEDLCDQLESPWSQSSYTRRGAGLPGLIQKILASEPPHRDRVLLPFTVSRLLAIASSNKMEFGQETEDSPVSHSLHILRCIVQDTHIARDISSFVSKIVASCLESFSSKSWAVRNAGLQLLGAVSPRIVGQKKMKEDHEEYNNVNVEDVESRFPGLIQMLVSSLNKNSVGYFVSPSLVPVLTLLSRLRSDNITSLSDLIIVSVSKYVGSPVHVVRSLVAKILSQVGKYDGVSLTEKVMSRLSSPEHYPTNEQHCDLLLVSRTLPDLSSKNNPDIIKIEENLTEIDKHLKCHVNKMMVMEMLKHIQKTLCGPVNISSVPCYSFEPGFHIWKENIDLVEVIDNIEDLELVNFATTSKAVAAVTEVQNNIDNAIVLFEKILNSDKSEIASGHVVDKMLDYFLLEKDKLSSSVNNQLFNSEVALELLDILQSDRLAQFGSTVTTKITLLKSVCLSLMMSQDDWEWFFGDTSEYVSKVVENTEQIENLASPGNIETSRLIAAQSIQSYLPLFKLKRISAMVLVLQFGFVNLLNAALTLLQDEDVEVKSAIRDFASQLPRFDIGRVVSNLTRVDSMRVVVWTGLDQLSQVVDMFSPIIQTVILPSQQHVVISSQTISGLFNKGEGINVYSEQFYKVKIYFDAIDQYLRNTQTKLDIKVNVENISTIGDNLVKDVLITEQRCLFRESRRKCELEAIASYQALLLLLLRHQLDEDQRDEHQDKIKTLLLDLSRFSLWKDNE